MNILSASIRSVLLSSPLLLSACGSGGGTKTTLPVVVSPPVVSKIYIPEVYPVENAGKPINSSNSLVYNHLARTHIGLAHQQGLTGSGVKIGVIDTGVNVYHPALQGSIKAVFNATDKELVKSITGERNHGTYVSQLIAGQGLGYFQGGVAPRSELYVADAEVLMADGSYGLPVSSTQSSIEWLMQSQVSIINNSWNKEGSSSSIKGQSLKLPNDLSEFVKTAQAAVNQDILFVYANGNEGLAQPGIYSLLPLYQSSLESGWLAVSSIERNSTQLSSYSNACGDAMNWCLVAPGEAYVKNTSYDVRSDTVFNSDTSLTGTSFATPLVSGTAALVQEKYPWMNSNQIRHTLLGTATDLGELGVDSIYGYGLLNAGKAVNGMEWLNWGQELVHFDSGVSQFSNDLYGSGGIKKSGSGLFILSGNNTYTGPTLIDEGQLEISGSSVSPVSIGSKGELILSGNVQNHVDNKGVLTSLGGTLNSLHHYQGSQWNVFLGAPTIVNNTLSLSGNLAIVGRVSDDYVITQKENIAVASEITGSFENVSIYPGILLEGHVEVSPNSIDFNVNRVNPTTLSLFQASSSGVELGIQLENAFTVADELSTLITDDSAQGFTSELGKVQSLQDEKALYNWTLKNSSQPMISSFNVLALFLHSDSNLVWERLLNLDDTVSGTYLSYSSDDWKYQPSGWLASRLSAQNLVLGQDWSHDFWSWGIHGRLMNGSLSSSGIRSQVESDTLSLYGSRKWGLWKASALIAYSDGSWKETDVLYKNKVKQKTMALNLSRSYSNPYGILTPSLHYSFSKNEYLDKNKEENNPLKLNFLSPSINLESWGATLNYQAFDKQHDSGWQWNWSSSLGFEKIQQHHGDWHAYYALAPEMIFKQNYASLSNQQWKGNLVFNLKKEKYALFARTDFRKGQDLKSWGWQIGGKISF